MKKYISVDIDGILNNYPDCWVHYVNMELSSGFASKDEIKEALGEKEYALIKDKYRHSDYKENLPARPEAVSLIDYFVEQGFSVIIATSRPIHDANYPHLKGLTERWLKKKNIQFDLLVFKDEDAKFVHSYGEFIQFHIEDELKYAVPIAKSGITVFWVDSSEATAPENQDLRIYRTRSLQSIREIWERRSR